MALYANGLAGYRLRWEPPPRSRCADASPASIAPCGFGRGEVGRTLHLQHVWLQSHR